MERVRGKEKGEGGREGERDREEDSSLTVKLKYCGCAINWLHCVLSWGAECVCVCRGDGRGEGMDSWGWG